MSITNKKYYPWLLVVIYSLLGIFFPAAVTQFSVVVPDLSQALGVSQDTVLLADSLRAVCLVIAMFLSGYVYNKLGLRKTMLLGLFFQITPQFVIPFAVEMGSLPMFFLAKGMQGLNSMAFPLYISTITTWMSSRYTGLATAIFNGSFVAGSGIGASIAGKIVPALGWKMSFYVIGGICLFFAIPVMLFTYDKPREKVEIKQEKKKGIYADIIRNPITWTLVIALVANTWVSQAVTVDMSVYTGNMGFSYDQTGKLMLIISFVTVISSIAAGYVSDYFAFKSNNRVKVRSLIMALGYVLSAATAFALPFCADMGFAPLCVAAAAMMFGANWASGVFWALPSEVYKPEDNVAGTAFCSSASNVPNPAAPFVVGVLLGSRGLWQLGWFTCGIVSVISLIASLYLIKFSKK